MNFNFYFSGRISFSPKGQDCLPLVLTFTSTGELNFKFNKGWNGGISYCYLHYRAGNEDYTLTTMGNFVTDLAVNYTQKKV